MTTETSLEIAIEALETIAYGRKGEGGLRFDWTSWIQQGQDSQQIAREALVAIHERHGE